MAIIKLNNNTLSAVTALPFGTGKLLQAVSAIDTTERNTTSTSFITLDSALTVNITPSATSSKIFVIVSTSTYNATANKSCYLTIYRNSTNLGNAQGFIRNLSAGGAAGGSSTCSILDSPSSTSQITYRVYAKQDSGGTLYLNANGIGTITAYEIAG